MIIGKKICLVPTKEQEELFWKSAGAARWAYNFFISENERLYEEFVRNNNTGKRYITQQEFRKNITILKRTKEPWLCDVGVNVVKQAIKDADNSMQLYFKKKSGKPKFRSRKRTKPSFYVNYETLSRRNGGFHGEKIGFVRTTEALPRLENGKKYSNPRITFDGKYWYLSFTYETHCENIEHTGEVIGIDLGIKNLATCSNGKVYNNINRTETVINIKKKIKRNRKKLTRKIKANIDYVEGNKFFYKRDIFECKNIQKQKKNIRLLYRRLTNIRNNYSHQVTTEIVKTKPSCVVMEDLDIHRMVKNKSVAKFIMEQKFFDFRKQMEYKCEKYGIKFELVPTFYPSSKMCSVCGNVKNSMPMNKRTYVCEVCGAKIDRDFNASINIARYVEK